MLSCFDVANYFLSLVDETAGDGISNLKLQKLVYYGQGFSLALTGEPLFSEPIEAWTHGPVVPALYHEYKRYGSGSIPTPLDFDAATIPEDTAELLDEVYNVYGQFSAWKLRDMTHEELPWKNAQSLDGKTISHEALGNYFGTRLAGS